MGIVENLPIIENPTLISNLPRKANVTHFRLLTAHDCLAQHLLKVGLKDCPNCLFCSLNSPMNVDHLAFCPALDASFDIVKKYWTHAGECLLFKFPTF